jgi:hypothetical protein
LIARRVPIKLALPERTIACGTRAVLWAAVPETAVHENGDAQLVKSEVRFSQKQGVPSPACDSLGAKQSRQRAFGLLVPVRPDARHYFRALRLTEDVGHDRSLPDSEAHRECDGELRRGLRSAPLKLYAAAVIWIYRAETTHRATIVYVHSEG